MIGMNRYGIILLLFFNVALSAQTGNTDYQYALIEAVKQKNLGNLPGAMELYRMVIEENDSVAVAHYELGTLLALTGESKEALRHLIRANDLDPDNKWFFESYIDVLLMNEEYKESVKLLKQRIRVSPENIDHLYKLANVYFLSGRAKRAIKTLVRIEENYGISDKITMLKANIYEKEKEYLKARREVEKLIEVFPESVEFHVVAAELALKNKNPDVAANLYEKVIDLDSLNIYALTNLTDYYRQKEQYSKSFFYLERSFRSEAIQYEKKMAILSFYLSDEYFFKNFYKELAQLIKTMLDQYPEKKEIHLFGTDFFIQHNQYGNALDALMPLLKPGESKYEVWKQGILLANATGRSEDMLTIATKAFRIFPDSAEILYYKGIAEYENKDFQALAETFSTHNIKKFSRDELISQARMLKAEALYRIGDYEGSDSLFRYIIRMDPDNYMAMNNFSYYLSERGQNLEEAEIYSRKTLEKDMLNTTYLDTYAWILFKMERFEDAAEYILIALENGGEDDAEVNEHAGDIFKELGRSEKAESFYQKAIILGGNEERLTKKIKKTDGQ